MIVVLTVVGLLGPLFVGSRVTAAQDADDLAQAFDELGAVVTDDANVPPELQPAFAATEIALPLPAVQNAPEAAPPDTCAAGHILLALRHHVEVAVEEDRYFTHQHNFGVVIEEIDGVLCLIGFELRPATSCHASDPL